MKVSESLKAFQPTPWEYLIRTSKPFAEAKALATRAIECGARGTDSVGPTVSTLAEQAVLAYFRNDQAGYAALVEGDPTDTAIHLPEGPRSIVDVRVCDGWGDDRLAFLQVTASFEARNEVGYRTFLAAVGTVADQPRVFMLGGSASNAMLSTLPREFARVPVVPASVPPPAQMPVVLGPDDDASATRMPPTARPNLVWKAPGASFCLVEWQFGSPNGGRIVVRRRVIPAV